MLGLEIKVFFSIIDRLDYLSILAWKIVLLVQGCFIRLDSAEELTCTFEQQLPKLDLCFPDI